MRHSQLAHYLSLNISNLNWHEYLSGVNFFLTFFCALSLVKGKENQAFSKIVVFLMVWLFLKKNLDWICEKLLDHNPYFIKLNNVH